MPDDSGFPDPGQVTTTVSARTSAPPPAGPGAPVPDDDGAGRGGAVTAQGLAEEPWPDPGQDDTGRGGSG